jgi:hypothetical protein
MLAAPVLIGRPMTRFIWLEWAEKEIELIQDGGRIKREKDIYHHSPRLIPMICQCHLPHPSYFLLVTTCNGGFSNFIFFMCDYFIQNWTASSATPQIPLCRRMQRTNPGLFDFGIGSQSFYPLGQISSTKFHKLSLLHHCYIIVLLVIGRTLGYNGHGKKEIIAKTFLFR